MRDDKILIFFRVLAAVFIIGFAISCFVDYKEDVAKKNSKALQKRIMKEFKDITNNTKKSTSTKKSSSSSKKSSSKSSGGKSYSDYEDFYYDNQEDFDSLDDAESYYEEHYSDY